MDKDSVIVAQQKKIAKLLANLPSKMLKERAKTADQRSYYDSEHLFNKMVSECWSAYFEGRNDPLRPRLNSGELARHEYNLIWQMTDSYIKFWGLIQISFEQIQSKLTKSKSGLVYSSACDLFFEAVRELADNEFSECFEPYYEVSLSKLLKARRLRRKIRSGKATTNDHKEYNALLPKEQNCPLFFLILKICNTSATKNERVMGEKLEDTYIALERLVESIETFFRYQGSYAWKNGKFIPGQVGGSYCDDA